MADQIYKTLSQLGLSENEIKVYTAALKLEETTPYELSKLTGVPRTTVYDVISDLSLKGLLKLERSDGFTKQQTKIRAKNPSTLRKKLREKHAELHNLEVELVHILPLLKKDYHEDKPSNSAFNYYVGIEGAKKVYAMEGELLGKMDINAITSLMPMDAFGKDFINKDVKIGSDQLLESDKEVNELIPLNEWTKHILTYQYERDPNYIKARNYRFIDSPIFEQFHRLYIAGGRVMIVSTHEDEAYGLSIKSKSLSQSWNSIFQLLWQQAIPITPELVESWGKNKFKQVEDAQ